MNVGVINRDENEALKKKYEVKKFPTIFIFGVDKSSPIRLEGKRKPKEVIDKAMAELKKLRGSSEEYGSSGGEAISMA